MRPPPPPAWPDQLLRAIGQLLHARIGHQLDGSAANALLHVRAAQAQLNAVHTALTERTTP